jgi:hypothetical protein
MAHGNPDQRIVTFYLRGLNYDARALLLNLVNQRRAGAAPDRLRIPDTYLYLTGVEYQRLRTTVRRSYPEQYTITNDENAGVRIATFYELEEVREYLRLSLPRELSVYLALDIPATESEVEQAYWFDDENQPLMVSRDLIRSWNQDWFGR